MIMEQPADYDHLLQHAQRLFPGAQVDITYTEDEIIHIDVDGHRYTFEIGSDDDEYVFDDRSTCFSIPLFLDATWDFS
ncbi:MAG: hypothetical protein EOP94_02895 [Zymomonas sp.]|nr:MAG: hypothetical protein EOP94_02895 [Zymomonas sp.]